MTVEITKAVAAVMEAVHRLKKDDKNNHGGYKYVSVDDVKDHIRPLLAKNGLEIAINETDYALEAIQGKNGTTISARFTFEIWLRHISGAESKADRTTVLLPHTGAQTTGAAKSYALKEWIKGRFLVSTGEKDYIEGGADADAYKPQEYTAAPEQPKQHSLSVHDDTPRNVPATAHLTGTQNAPGNAAAKELFAQLTKELTAAKSKQALEDWLGMREDEINKLPSKWMHHFDDKFEEHEAALSVLTAFPDATLEARQ
jgi:hypothetical protein